MTVWLVLRLVLATGLGFISLFILELSVVAVVVILILVLSLPELSRRPKRIAYGVFAAAALAATVGLARFVLTKAMAGIVQGGQKAALKSAIWRMREIVIAQDGARKRAIIDPDGDGIGSAVLISPLAGLAPLRNGRPLEQPLLNYRFSEVVQTKAGPAVRVGSHLAIVCLPTRDGGFSAKPAAPIDEERAERRFLAYAWPASTSRDIGGTIFVDEHERILLSSKPAYRGPAAAPSCTAALAKPDDWESWRDKAPRQTLPGDRP